MFRRPNFDAHFFKEENDKIWREMYSEHPCVQELKERFIKTNTSLVLDRRLNIMQEGEVFPKLPEKVKT